MSSRRGGAGRVLLGQAGQAGLGKLGSPDGVGTEGLEPALEDFGHAVVVVSVCDFVRG